MTLSIAERVQEMRQQIAEISKESTAFARTGRRDVFGKNEQEARFRKLEQIKDELISLGVWKKS